MNTIQFVKQLSLVQFNLHGSDSSLFVTSISSCFFSLVFVCDNHCKL